MPLDRARRWISPYEGADSIPALPVFVAQNAYRRAVEHAASDLDNEVGGVLVGNWFSETGTDRPFIVVETALPARFTRQGSVYLTFTQDSLVDLRTEMDEHYPDKETVGWYHTHPRMGVFLSQYDTWLHTYFFPEKWQVALVIEPFNGLGGFFIRQPGSGLDPSRYIGFYELDGGSGRSIVQWRNMQDGLQDNLNEGIHPEGDESHE